MAPQLRVMAITSRGPKINSYAHICKSSSREPKTLSDLLGHIQARAHKHTQQPKWLLPQAAGTYVSHAISRESTKLVQKVPLKASVYVEA